MRDKRDRREPEDMMMLIQGLVELILPPVALIAGTVSIIVCPALWWAGALMMVIGALGLAFWWP